MEARQMPPTSRVWIFQSQRELSQTECNEIQAAGNAFVEQWSSHGAKMQAAFEIRHQRFLVIFADEEKATASGCSIDSCVQFIKSIEATYQLNLLDRAYIAYQNGDSTHTFHFSEFEKMYEAGILKPETLVFNNQVTTKEELESQWVVSLKDTWLNGRI